MKEGAKRHIVTLDGHAIYAYKNYDGDIYWLYAKGDGTDYMFKTYEEAVKHISRKEKEQ